MTSVMDILRSFISRPKSPKTWIARFGLPFAAVFRGLIKPSRRCSVPRKSCFSCLAARSASPIDLFDNSDGLSFGSCSPILLPPLRVVVCRQFLRSFRSPKTVHKFLSKFWVYITILSGFVNPD